MQNANDARRKSPFESLANDDLVSLNSSFEKDVQKGAVFQKKMSEDFRNCEDNMAMGNVKHAFSKCIGALHVIEVAAGWTETGLAGERNPAELFTVVTGIHCSVFRVSAVQNFFNF